MNWAAPRSNALAVTGFVPALPLESRWVQMGALAALLLLALALFLRAHALIRVRKAALQDLPEALHGPASPQQAGRNLRGFGSLLLVAALVAGVTSSIPIKWIVALANTGVLSLALSRWWRARSALRVLSKFAQPKLLERLERNLSHAQTSRTAQTRKRRAERSLELLHHFDALRLKIPTSASRSELRAIARCADVIDAVEKARNTRTSSAQSRHLLRAKELMTELGIDDAELLLANARDPRNNAYIRLTDIESDLSRLAPPENPVEVEQTQTEKLATASSRAATPATPEVAPSIEREAESTEPPAVAEKWFGPGSELTVAGVTIGSGMVYARVPSANDSELGGSLERPPEEPSCLVDLDSAPIKRSKGKDSKARPSLAFANLSKRKRDGYLQWLAWNRADPDAPPEYLQLFLYGLERRVLSDYETGQFDSNELPLLHGELSRLLEHYAERSDLAVTLKPSLEALRERVELQAAHSGLRQALAASQPEAGDALERPENAKQPQPADLFALRVELGQLALAGADLSADLALQWARNSKAVALRRSAQRCHSEFDRLFRILFERSSSAPQALTNIERKIVTETRAQNPSLGRPAFVFTSKLPDLIDEPTCVRQIAEVANTTSSRLAPYSRLLGKQPKLRGSLRAATLLPEELQGREHPALAELAPRLETLFCERKVGEQSCAALPGAEILSLWNTSETVDQANATEWTRATAVAAAQLFGRLGYGFEPDPRFGGPPPKDDGQAVLFKLIGDDHQSPSDAYRAAVVLLGLGTLVAGADGSIGQAEQDKLEDSIQSALNLDAGERRRLEAHLAWLLKEPPSLVGLRKRVSKLDLDDRSKLGSFLVSIAWADGYADPREVALLERVFAALELDHKELHAKLHAAATGVAHSDDDSNPVLIDPERVAKKFEQTARVGRLLGRIFEEEEPEQDLHEAPETAGGNSSAADPQDAVEGNPLAGLDRKHSALLRALSEKSVWERDEYESLASELGLFPDGALETLNDLAWDKFDAPLLEQDEQIELDPELLQQLLVEEA